MARRIPGTLTVRQWIGLSKRGISPRSLTRKPDPPKKKPDPLEEFEREMRRRG